MYPYCLTQVEAAAEAKFKGVFHATATMLREEGLRSFWKGHMPAQYLSISYGVFQFGTFQATTKARHFTLNNTVPSNQLVHE